MQRWISLIVLLAIIAITGAVLYRVMATFLLPLFLATVLTVIFRPVHVWIRARCRDRAGLAALLTTIVILLVVLAPMGLVLTLAVREGIGAVSGDVLDRAEFQIAKFRRRIGLDIPFRMLPGNEGDSPFGLPQLDRLIGNLPDQLPPQEEISGERRDEMLEALSAVRRLSDHLRDMRRLAEADSQDDDDSLEMERVKRMLRTQRDSAFEPLDEIATTLVQTLQFAKYGVQALRPEPTLEELLRLEDEEQAAEQAAEEAAEEAAGEAAGEAAQQDAAPDVDAETLTPLVPELEDDRWTMSELRKRFGRMKASYFGFRIDLMGGAFWAGLTDFANPVASQIDALRANAQRYLRGWLPSVAGQATAWIGSVVLGLAIMSLGIFYFLKDGPAMIRSLMRLFPLDDRYEEELLGEFDTVSRAVVLATLLSALGQSLLAGIAYTLAGFNSVFLLIALTLLFAMVPFIGAAAVWVPTCLWLAFVEERFFAAMLMFGYGVGVISMADNVIKPYVLHGQSKLHPLLALLSVLGGVQALGPIGILVGPMIVSFLQALLNILQQELQALDRPERVGS